MGCRNNVARRIGRSGCTVGRAAGAVVEGLEARCLLSAVLFVDDSAVGSGDGSSWGNAFADLQAALGQAVYGDEIRIAAGTYWPTRTTDRTISFVLRDGISLLGGYAGYGAADPDAHDVALYPTVLSGDIGTAGDNTDNSYHVIVASGISSATVLDGLTITAGYADGSLTDSYGGGMYNESSSPTLTNCTFSGNTASVDGGGMYNDDSSPTLTNCTFSANTAGSQYYFRNGFGGGMYNVNSAPTLTNCTFRQNRAAYGGGMYNNNSSPVLVGCSFTDSRCIVSDADTGRWYDSGGGGMYNASSSPHLIDCLFTYNTAGSGGGMYNATSHPVLDRCTFTGNSAYYINPSGIVTIFGGHGGALYNSGSWVTLRDCTFYGNRAPNNDGSRSNVGGAVFNNYQSPLTATNCVFVNNAAGAGGAIYGDSITLTNCTLATNGVYGKDDANNWGRAICSQGNPSSITIVNSIIWGPSTGQISNGGGGRMRITHSDIRGGYPGTGNINRVPRFVRDVSPNDDDYGDLHLQPGSTCTNAGKNSVSGLVGISTDRDGDPRIVGGKVDMGAYESPGRQSNVLQLLPAIVQENQPVGTLVGTLSTAAQTAGDTYTYSLVDGTGSFDNDRFAISGNQIVTNSVFDYDAESRHSIRVGATDQDGKYVEKVLTITIAPEPGSLGAKHALILTDTDSDAVTIAIHGGGEGMLLPGGTIALTGTTTKSVLAITVKKGTGGDGLFQLSGVTSDGPLKAINASAVVLSGRVQINTLNQDAGKGSVSLKFRTISDAEVRVQGVAVSAITVGGMVSDSRIVTTGAIGKFRAAVILNSDVLVGVAGDFAGQFAGHDDFINSTAKLGSLTVTGQKLPKGSSYPAYVSGVHVSAPSVGAMKLANVDGTAETVQVHVLADTGRLTITALNPVMGGVSVLTAGSWKPDKEGRPGIWVVV